MDKKFFVPFETAKLLKEKGYPQLEPEHYYNINGEMVIFSDDYEGYTEDIIMKIAQDFYAAPTYHEVVDWLEKKWYPVEVMWTREHSELVWNCLVNHEMTKNYPTREGAINAAILKVLEKL